MPADPHSTQTEQTFWALVERMNAQFIPDLNSKLNDHSIDHIAAVDAALAQTHAVESQLASIQATANLLGADRAHLQHRSVVADVATATSAAQ